MLNSDLSPAAPQGGRGPPQIKPVSCPRADGFRQTESPAGYCNHPLSRSPQTLLCHRISWWMVKLVGWGLCTPFSLSTSLAHGFLLFMLCHVVLFSSLILSTKPFGDRAMDDGCRLRIELAASSSCSARRLPWSDGR